MTSANADLLDPESGPFRIGLIADIQYADMDDGTDFAGTEQRHFRNSLRIAEAAVSCWNDTGVNAVVQLGDLIDGCNRQAGASKTALQAVLSVLERSIVRRFDLIGNHELYNIRRPELPTSGLNCFGADGLTYYAVHIGSHWEAIFLDPYEFALIGFPMDHPNYLRAKSVIEQHNPQVFKDDGPPDWFSGLPEEKHRYVPFNGSVSPEQLAWLEKALVQAAADGRRTLIFTHIPLFRPATKPKTTVWNCDELLAVIHRHTDTVVAVLAGHDHEGGYAVDPVGVHHITMNSALTANVGTDCFAILELYNDGWARFVAHGRACVESGTCGQGQAYPELLLTRGEGNNEAPLAQLVAMGFDRDVALAALESAAGDVNAAVSILSG